MKQEIQTLFDTEFQQKEIKVGMFMLYTLAVILGVLWILGLVTSYTLGGYIHIFVVAAVVVLLLRIFSDKRHSNA